MTSTQLPYVSDLFARTSVVKDYHAKRVQDSGLRLVMVASRTRGAGGLNKGAASKFLERVFCDE
eukprot:5934975-Lingulodinium_polyedra.AAC.1